MSQDLKPCEYPCDKCGSGDVLRQFVAQDEHVPNKHYNKAPGKFVSGQGHIYRATQDHLRHHCRCCHYEWQTKPMAKRRAARAQEPQP